MLSRNHNASYIGSFSSPFEISTTSCWLWLGNIASRDTVRVSNNSKFRAVFLKNLLLRFKIYETAELPHHASQLVNLSFSALLMQNEYFFFVLNQFELLLKIYHFLLEPLLSRVSLYLRACFKASQLICLCLPLFFKIFAKDPRTRDFSFYPCGQRL